MAKKKIEVTTETLSEIRKSIQQIDARRADKTITEEQRMLLEESAVLLRDSERYAIQTLTKTIGSELQLQLEPICERSKEIRERITKMSKVPKAIDAIEQIVAVVVPLLRQISDWKI